MIKTVHFGRLFSVKMLKSHLSATIYSFQVLLEAVHYGRSLDNCFAHTLYAVNIYTFYIQFFTPSIVFGLKNSTALSFIKNKGLNK